MIWVYHRICLIESFQMSTCMRQVYLGTKFGRFLTIRKMVHVDISEINGNQPDVCHFF